MTLHEHRVAELGADLTSPSALVPMRRALRGRTTGKVTRDHRVVDTLGRDAVDESTRVARQHDARRRGGRKRPPHRDQERREMRPTRCAIEHSPMLQLANETPL